MKFAALICLLIVGSVICEDWDDDDGYWFSFDGDDDADSSSYDEMLGNEPANRILIGQDNTDDIAADDDATDQFAYLDLNDPEDGEDLEHRRHRHSFCAEKCVKAKKCQRHKKSLESAENGKCPAKVHECSSCILECKKNVVKCEARALNLKVEQIKEASEKMAVGLVCDKCNLNSAIKQCKSRKTSSEEFDDDDDDDSFIWTLPVADEGDEEEGGDVYYDIYSSKIDGESFDPEYFNVYNVSDDLEGKGRPRKCEIPVNKIPQKKIEKICRISKCVVKQLKALQPCTTNVAPATDVFAKALDRILKCQRTDEDDSALS